MQKYVKSYTNCQKKIVKYIQKCAKMCEKYANMCKNMSKYAKNISKYAKICQIYAKICQNMSNICQICKHVVNTCKNTVNICHILSTYFSITDVKIEPPRGNYFFNCPNPKHSLSVLKHYPKHGGYKDIGK